MVSHFSQLIRLRYSVRGLLIVVTLLCFVMGWFAIRMRHAQEQAAAAKELKAGIVVVGYDYMLDTHGDYTGSDMPPVGFLRRWLGNDFFSNVVRVEYPAGKLPKCGLTPLDNVWGLRLLSLRGTKVADADFSTNALKGLQSLDAAFTDITDAAVDRLAVLSRLQSLDLSGTQITDASLEKLTACPKLRYLTLRDTLTSESAIQRLRQHKPLIDVVWSPPASPAHQKAMRHLAQLGATVYFVDNADAVADLEISSVFMLQDTTWLLLATTIFGTTGEGQRKTC